MPAPEVSDLHQKAVYWEASGVDDYGNKKILKAIGDEIPVRWTQGLKEAVDSKGNVVAASDSAIVDQEIVVGSIMWLGKLADLPDPYTDLRQVIDYSETLDIKGRVARRKILLMRFHDTLPSVA